MYMESVCRKISGGVTIGDDLRKYIQNIMTAINDNAQTMHQIEQCNPDLFHKINHDFSYSSSPNIFNAPILEQLSPRTKHEAKKWSSQEQTKKPRTKIDISNL